ncbi:MAG: IPTL-CTERM sorting domain-containing protein [Acidobacteriota bacterium]
MPATATPRRLPKSPPFAGWLLAATLGCLLFAPSLAFADITGNAFRDFDASGSRGALEPGIGGVVVNAFGGAGTAVGNSPQTTASDGTFTLTGLPTGPLRLELTLPTDDSLAFLFPGAAGSTTVIFTADGTSPEIGFSNPAQYCQADPLAASACFVSGDPLPVGSAAGALDALVSWPISRTGNTIPPDEVALASEVGTLWGLAWARSREVLYASATLRRHSGLGPLSTGGVYAIDMSNPATPVVSTFLTLSNTGLDPRTEEGSTLPTDPSADSLDVLAFAATAKRGLGDLEISEDESTLYVVNLNTRSLVEIDIAGASEGTATPIGDPGCAAATDARPFGLKVIDGEVFVGVVCSAESTGNRSDLTAYVRRLSGGAFTNFFGPIALDYPRTNAFNATAGDIDWQAWTDTFMTTDPPPGFDGADVNSVYPQPILSDIEFDSTDGSMILSFLDRQGLQTGALTLTPDGTTRVQTISAGDILHVCRNGAGAFALEDAGTCDGQGSGTTAGDGPGGGEYYDQDRFSNHKETILGGLSHYAGAASILATLFDPFAFRSAGTSFFDNSDGSLISSFEIFGTDQVGTFGKAAGLGDVELLCAPAPIEIGNRVWCDAPMAGDMPNGIQDPPGASGVIDTPLSGVTLSLSCNGGTVTGTTMTAADGSYLFNDSNVTGGIPPGATCTVSLDTSQGALGTCTDPTFANAGSAADPGQDLRDSDGTDLDMDGTLEATIQVGGPGANDHRLDFGLRIPPIPLLTATKTDIVQVDGDFDGQLDGGDTLRYTVVITNSGDADATATTFTSSVDAATSLVVASVTTSQGTVTTGNTAGDTTVAVDIGTLAMGGATVTITYDVILDNPAPVGLDEILCQGTVDASNHPTVSTDDPDVANSTDPTATPVDAEPMLAATKVDTLLVDDGDARVDPGDTVRYTVVISNAGDQDAGGVEFSSLVDNLTSLVVGSVTTSQGTVTTGNTGGDSSVAVDVGTLAGAGGSVTITFDVTVDAPLPANASELTCQGSVTAGGGISLPTDDPDDATGSADPTLTPLDPGEDFGDAPDSYGTTLAANGPNHRIVTGFRLGSLEDAEPDGQDSADALGDDGDSQGDDEDGVDIVGGMPGACTSGNQLMVNLTNEAGLATAFLDGWIDWNGNGSFDHPAEHLFGGTSAALGPASGTFPLTYSAPCDATPQAVTFARFRLSSAGSLLPTGSAAVADGEVEDFSLQIKGVDFGDAPDTYATTGSGGASHTIVPGFSLGSANDTEPDGQPTSDALGDDSDADGDDEDGVAFAGGMAMAAACSNGNGLTVTLDNAAGLGTAFLDAWIDWNRNDVFDDPAEHLFGGTSAALTTGANSLTYDVPCTAVAGTSYARFRLSSAGGLAPGGGPAADGEVEDYTFLLKGLDYGDAPDPTYPVLLASDGGRHVVQPTGNPTLGTTVDTEPDGQPSATHDGDDLAGSPDDEDGVQLPASLLPGKAATFDLTGGATGGLVDAWIDWNRDGDWLDAGEQIATGLAVAAGATIPLVVGVPADAAAGSTCARFRISTAGGLAPTGLAADGEVEDYQVLLGEAQPAIGASKEVTSVERLSPTSFRVVYQVGIENFGNVTLQEVQATVDLATAFADAVGFTAEAPLSADFTVNGAFDGSGDTALLVTGNTLAPGSIGFIELAVIVEPGPNPGPYLCSTLVSGESVDGQAVEDMSHNGDDADPDGNQDPSDNQDPTPVELTIAVLEIPTLSQWGLLLMALGLACLAARRLRLG